LNRREIIENILDIEWKMFQQVKSAIPASCQLMPEAFRRIRGSVYETWSEEALKSCLLDFEKAQQDGRNLLTEKYAQMDGLITPVQKNPLIDEIVAIETDWQKDIRRNYPTLYNHVCRSTNPFNDGRNFTVYLRSELQTYGDRTIDLYYKWVSKALENNDNLALKSLDALVKKGGYRDIEHAEEVLSKNSTSEQLV
jgi:hypothetical protein